MSSEVFAKEGDECHGNQCESIAYHHGDTLRSAFYGVKPTKYKKALQWFLTTFQLLKLNQPSNSDILLKSLILYYPYQYIFNIILNLYAS